MEPEVRDAFERLPERIKQCLRPSLLARTSRADSRRLPLGASRIGGCPDLPEDFDWPEYEGRPLAFTAQLNLTELAAQPEVLALPKAGSLVFFYDPEKSNWGNDPLDSSSVPVVYYLEPDEELVRTEVPDEVPDEGLFECCSLKFSVDQNLPGSWWPYYAPKLTESERYLFGEFERLYDREVGRPRHRIGGHEDTINGGMELECQLASHGLTYEDLNVRQDPRAKALVHGATDWRLLLQIDSDDDAGMAWVDAGTLYYWIRQQDLASEQFEESRLILQFS